jgi:hypothetical protein
MNGRAEHRLTCAIDRRCTANVHRFCVLSIAKFFKTKPEASKRKGPL